ncbi:MAG: DoxX family protein [Thermodesulfobacteriota bacterium]
MFGNSRDIGLLILRIGVGLSMMIFHGLAKIKGGPEGWEKTGSSMSNLGIDFFPVFWGFMASFSEFFGSFFIIVGFFFKPAASLLIFTMLVAIVVHLSLPAGAENAGWSGASHAIELLTVYVALLLTGPGKYKIFK